MSWLEHAAADLRKRKRALPPVLRMVAGPVTMHAPETAAIRTADDIETRAAAGEIAAQLELADRQDAAGRPELATRWLGAAAKQGSLHAIAQLGARTIAGAGCAARPADGIALLEYAGGAGSGLALRHLATAVLSGVAGPADRARGMALAGKAAAAGDERTKAELDTLPNWAEESAAADAVLSADPLVLRIEHALSPLCCAWLREWCAPALSRAGTTDRRSGMVRYDTARTNRFARIGLFDQPLELLLFKLRLSALLGQPVEHFEGTNLLAYRPGEKFAAHHDYFDPAEAGFAAELAERGQRVATVLVALNADYEGGETAFPELGVTWRGQIGEGLCFRNLGADGAPAPRSLHAGMPPLSGSKWVLSQWVRDRPQAPA